MTKSPPPNAGGELGSGNRLGTFDLFVVPVFAVMTSFTTSFLQRCHLQRGSNIHHKQQIHPNNLGVFTTNIHQSSNYMRCFWLYGQGVFYVFIYISIKNINGTVHQRSPDQVSLDRAIRYSGFCSGSVKSGSCW